MLRVRPLHFTSRMDSWDRLLTALGMVRTEDDAGWQVFDAGSGRLALHAVPEGAQDGSTALAVESGSRRMPARPPAPCSTWAPGRARSRTRTTPRTSPPRTAAS